MSNSKTVELLLQRKLALMQEIAEIDRALKAIHSTSLTTEERDAYFGTSKSVIINDDLDGNPMHQIGHGRGDD